MDNIRIIDLGEYIVEIIYDEKTGELEVSVLDELGGVIESINITNTDDKDFNPRLN